MLPSLRRVFGFRAARRYQGWGGLALGLACASFAGDGMARTIRVAQDGSGDYLWIQEALQAADPNDVIVVSPGTYRERLSFPVFPVTVQSLEGPEVTTIDADSTGSVILMDLPVGRGTVVEGFTLIHGIGTILRQGRAEPESEIPDAAAIRLHERENRDDRNLRYGGGALLISASPTLRRLIFLGNGANYGGGLYVQQGIPLVEDCLFLKNFAFGGGAVCVDHSDGARFTGCHLAGQLGVRGGAIYLEEGWAEFDSCRFEANTASEGGVLYFFGSGARASVNRSIFAANRARTAAVALVTAGLFELSASTLYDNGVPLTDSGTIVLLEGSSGTIRRTILAEPAAQRHFQIQSETALVSCCDLWPNEALPRGVGAEVFSEPPRFCDPARGDFRLQEGSPCLPEATPPGCGLVGALSVGCRATSTGPDGSLAR